MDRRHHRKIVWQGGVLGSFRSLRTVAAAAPIIAARGEIPNPYPLPPSL
jgi:hypothetical protein